MKTKIFLEIPFDGHKLFIKHLILFKCGRHYSFNRLRHICSTAISRPSPHVLAVPVWIQFPADRPGRAVEDILVLGSQDPPGQLSGQWPSLGHCKHLGSEPAGGRCSYLTLCSSTLPGEKKLGASAVA